MGRSLSGGIKLAAEQMLENSKMCNLRYGTVISESPLKVKITEHLTLPSKVLIVPQHLTDYEVEVSLNADYGWITEDTQNGSPLSPTLSSHNHKHDIVQSKKKVFIHNALKVGDKIALLQATGGQSYFILDRI